MQIKNIKDFPGYAVSEDGDVFSLNYNHMGIIKKLKPCMDRKGYLQVHLSKNGKGCSKTVHRLVARAFIPNTTGLPEINHKNGVRTDNRVENIEWCTFSENNKYTFAVLGRKHPLLGAFEDKNPHAKPVIQIFPDGSTKEYACAIRAGKETHTSIEGIRATCRNEQKTAGGYEWRWK